MIKKLIEQKIEDFNSNNILPNHFYCIDNSTKYNNIYELHYYDKEGNCLKIESPKEERRNKERALITMKEKLILEITYEKYKELIEKYDNKLNEIKNSEGWYKYENGAKYLIENEILKKDEIVFLKEYIEIFLKLKK